jgi:hypothetical protein
MKFCPFDTGTVVGLVGVDSGTNKILFFISLEVESS